MKTCICGREVQIIDGDILIHWNGTASTPPVKLVDACKDEWLRESESTGL